MVNLLILMSGQSTRLLKYIHTKKQFYHIDGKPLFIITLENFINDNRFDNIFLVIDKDDEELVKIFLKKYKYLDKVSLIHGGSQREESVYNGLKYLKKKKLDDSIVFIHDCARPIVSKELLDSLFETIKTNHCVIPYVKIPNALFNIKSMEYAKREENVEIQTPQVFEFEYLYSSMNKCDLKSMLFYDEGSILKNDGKEIKLIEGDQANIKISDIRSLDIVCALLKVYN